MIDNHLAPYGAFVLRSAAASLYGLPSGQNLTMESGEGFPAKVSHARLAHAHRDIHRRLAG